MKGNFLGISVIRKTVKLLCNKTKAFTLLTSLRVCFSRFNWIDTRDTTDEELKKGVFLKAVDKQAYVITAQFKLVQRDQLHALASSRNETIHRFGFRVQRITSRIST